MRKQFHTIALIAAMLAITFTRLAAQGTQVVIGELRNGVAVITEPAKASTLLKANLSPTAILSDIKLEFSEFDGTYFLTARVANDMVSSIGVQLGQDNTALVSGPGIGVEVTCTGRNCTDCRLIISKWRPRCRCEEPTAPDFACDMTQKAVLNIGY
jgi:hypothetical protein